MARFFPLSALEIANVWLERLRRALVASNPGDALTHILLPSCHLRDQLLLSWDVRTLSSHEAIAAYITAGIASDSGFLGAGGLSGVALDKRAGLAPEILDGLDQPGAVRLAWTFESTHAKCRGSARLIAPAADGRPHEWLASSVFLMVDSIEGHEEFGHLERGLYGEGGIFIPWEQVKRERQEAAERDPYVVVVGAGQTGLQVTARLQQLGIPTLLIERRARVGDGWRQCYDSLTLQTPRKQHELLYMPYPDTWPRYTPKDKLANWLTGYADMLDLVVWTSTTLTPDTRPTYDTLANRWTLSVLRDGEHVTLKPAHIVLATGTLGAPHMPVVPDAELFRGEISHSSAYKRGAPFARHRVLVVGAGNSGTEICGDLAGVQAQVTLLQRSPTAVLLPGLACALYRHNYPETLDVDTADFRLFSLAPGVRIAHFSAARTALVAAGVDPDCANANDVRRKAGLTARGFLVGGGHGNGGYVAEFSRRFAGYFLDKGFSDLVLADRVAIKSGTGLARFTPSGVVLEDGTALNVDSVIFATGYEDARVGWATVFGEEVIERAGHAWGLDDEGEFRGVCRPTGQSGLWYAGGGFEASRWGSKTLGLLIQAERLGLWKR